MPAAVWPQTAPPAAAPLPVLPTVEVRASGSVDALAEQAQEQAREALSQRAGGTALVTADSFRQGRAATLTDALAWAPGVLAQTRHGQEARFSIRGSGIQRGFLMRGIQIYQDGTPLNQADGAGDFQSVDPLSTQYVEVWRGANALEYGANGLGGAVNFVSPTGLTAPRASLRLQAGSFGQQQVQASLAGRHEALDGYLSVSDSRQDGWREQSATRTRRVSANVGAQVGEGLELRAFLAYLDADLQMPGSLTRAALNTDPRQAAPGYVNQNAVNNYTRTRGAVRATWQLSDQVRWTTVAHTSERDRFHAMTMGILQQDLRDSGFDSRVVAAWGPAGLTRQLTAGLSSARLKGEEWRFANVGGQAGAATGRNTLRARQDTLYGEYAHGLDERWTVQAGAQAVRVKRRVDNHTTPSASYDTAFDHVAPKLGVLYALTPTAQAYANVSGSDEVPPIGEMVVRPQWPLGHPQKATTVEAGWRGRAGDLSWDMAVYHARVRHELLALTDATGAALGTTNADRTVHQGLELSASVPVAPSFALRLQYLYNDFRFDGDPLYGDKRLAGIPPHLLRAELRWKAAPWLTVTPGLEWLPGKTWVDHANTVSTPGYALWNLTFSGELGQGWSWFVEGRNLSDRRYVATTAVQAQVRGADGAYYFPGDGRAVYAGLSWRMP